MKRSFYVAETGQTGRGVFAGRDIKPFEFILPFQGPLLTRDAVYKLPNSSHVLQIGENLWLGRSGEADDYVNHSCFPNCGVVFLDGVPWLRSIAAVEEKQELLFDYSTMSMNEPEPWDMPCHCGAPGCRKIIGNYSSLTELLQERYLDLGIIPAFVLNEPVPMRIVA